MKRKRRYPMKRLLTLTLALLLAVALVGVSGATKYAYAEGDGEEPAEAAEPVNPYVGLWQITAQQDGDEYVSLAEAKEKIYMDFLPSGAIYAVMFDGEDAEDDYLAYEVTGENTLNLFEGDDEAIPAVYDPEKGVITVTFTDDEDTFSTFLERVTEEPLPDIRALVDHSQEEQTYYGYLMISGDQSVSMLDVLPAMGMDPEDFYVTLNPDGTGYLQFGEEEAGGEITWTETELTADGESVPYTRQGDHIQLTLEGMLVEFAPEGEVEALLAMKGEDEIQEIVVVDPDAFVGEWKLAKGSAAGQIMTTEQLQAQGLDLAFRFNGDGSAVMIDKGEETDGINWRVEDGALVLYVGTYDMFTFDYDGEYLTLSMGAKLYFERVD